MAVVSSQCFERTLVGEGCSGGLFLPARASLGQLGRCPELRQRRTYYTPVS